MIYQYECPGDGTTIDIERKISDPEESYYCSTCGAMLSRVYSAPSVVFNGTGFYTTDNPKQ